jgi:hypothetical protein
MSNIKSIDMFRVALVGLIGFLLVFFVDSNVVAAEVVIAVTFTTNLFLLYSENFLHLKSQIKSILTAFIFGALVGVIFI